DAQAQMRFVPIGDFPGGPSSPLPAPEFYSNANAVSGDGLTIVGSGRSVNGFADAFLWREGTGLLSLGDLPGGTYTSQAFAASFDGSVIVGNSIASAD